MTDLSVNGWPVLDQKDKQLVTWKIPSASRTLNLRWGSAGFLLVHWAVWWDDVIEPLDRDKQWDDWGWASRPIRGQVSGYSNHASGTAVDLNATKHPRGAPIHNSFSDKQIRLIRRRLDFYSGCLEWGGNWPSFPGSTALTDGMHVEINRSLNGCERKARRLLSSPRGKRILQANPHQRAVILS
jgi:hypothetical protein